MINQLLDELYFKEDEIKVTFGEKVHPLFFHKLHRILLGELSSPSLDFRGEIIDSMKKLLPYITSQLESAENYYLSDLRYISVRLGLIEDHDIESLDTDSNFREKPFNEKCAILGIDSYEADRNIHDLARYYDLLKTIEELGENKSLVNLRY